MAASLKVEIKYSNRQFSRIYIVASDGEFSDLVAAVKATGATWQPLVKRWKVNKTQLDALKAAFSVRNADFELRGQSTVIFVATDETVWQPRVFGYYDAREYYDQAQQEMARLQAAYNQSDDVLKAALG